MLKLSPYLSRQLTLKADEYGLHPLSILEYGKTRLPEFARTKKEFNTQFYCIWLTDNNYLLEFDKQDRKLCKAFCEALTCAIYDCCESNNINGYVSSIYREGRSKKYYSNYLTRLDLTNSARARIIGRLLDEAATLL